MGNTIVCSIYRKFEQKVQEKDFLTHYYPLLSTTIPPLSTVADSAGEIFILDHGGIHPRIPPPFYQWCKYNSTF